MSLFSPREKCQFRVILCSIEGCGGVSPLSSFSLPFSPDTTGGQCESGAWIFVENENKEGLDNSFIK